MKLTSLFILMAFTALTGYSQKISIKPEFSTFVSSFSTGKDSMGYIFNKKTYYVPIKFSPVIGTKYGIHLIYSFSNNYALSAGLSYLQWGGRYKIIEVPDETMYYYCDQTIQSLEIPVIAQYGKSLNTNLDIHAGLGLSFKHTFKSVFRFNTVWQMFYNNVKVTRQDTSYAEEPFSTNSLGLVLQAGIKKKLTDFLTLNASVEWNSSCFFKNYKLNASSARLLEDFKVRYNMVGLNLGLIYTLNSKFTERTGLMVRNKKIEIIVSGSTLVNPKIEGKFEKPTQLTSTLINKISSSTRNISSGYRLFLNYSILPGFALSIGAGFLKTHGNYTNTYIFGKYAHDTTVFESEISRDILTIPVGFQFKKIIFRNNISIFIRPTLGLAYSRDFRYLPSEVDVFVMSPDFSDRDYNRFGLVYSAETGLIFPIRDDLSLFLSGNFMGFDRDFMTLEMSDLPNLSGYVRFRQFFAGVNAGIIF